METILNQIIKGMSSIPYLSNLFVRLDLQKKYLQKFQVRFGNLTLEANAKQLKVARVGELIIKNDNLVTAITRKVALGNSDRILQRN